MLVQINSEIANWEALTIEIAEDKSVHDLKAEVAQAKNIPKEICALWLNGQELTSGQLKNYSALLQHHKLFFTYAVKNAAI